MKMSISLCMASICLFSHPFQNSWAYVSVSLPDTPRQICENGAKIHFDSLIEQASILRDSRRTTANEQFTSDEGTCNVNLGRCLATITAAYITGLLVCELYGPVGYPPCAIGVTAAYAIFSADCYADHFICMDAANFAKNNSITNANLALSNASTAAFKTYEELMENCALIIVP